MSAEARAETMAGHLPAMRPAALTLGKVVLALAFLIAVLGFGVVTGPVKLNALAVMRDLASHLPFLDVHSTLSAPESAIVWQLRMPRVLLGAIVGAMLALSGAAYQGVFRNPLADPYLLGAAAGAGLGATLAIAYGPAYSSWPLGLLPVAAFLGAIGGVTAAYSLGRAAGGRTSTTLVLAGVAVASFLTAVQIYLQQRAEAGTFREVYAWILGGLGTASWREVKLILPYAVICAAALLLHRRLLEVISVGEEEADSLGIRSSRVRLAVVAAASLGTAAAVSVAGLIGFVGIIVPHTVRLILGPSHRILMPLSLIGGGAFLVLADVLARTLVSPAEIPIGVVTAFFGAPFFALVLRTSRRAI